MPKIELIKLEDIPSSTTESILRREDVALDCFGRLEALGHQSFIGKLSEETIAGAGFIRIDITSGEKTVTVKYFAPGSIYAITPMSEEEYAEVERYAVARLLPRPTHVAVYPDDHYDGPDDDGEETGL